MQRKEIIYERIYSDFQIRLCEGEFPKGSSIPSLPDLCRHYKVGKNTILKVLQMLKENGFIATSPGKVGQVLFDCNRLDNYLMELPGFICDKELLVDYYHAIRVLFPPIYTHASLAFSEAQLAEIGELIERLAADEASSERYIRLSARLLQATLSATNNQLFKTIVEVTMRKTVLPAALLCGHNEIFKPLLLQGAATSKELCAALKQKDPVYLTACWQRLLSTYTSVLEQALAFGIFPTTPSLRETSLFQEIAEEKCFMIAADFRHKILREEYIPGDFLPAISQAKQQYQVSTITVRRAYQILGEMGLVQTINGRGTEVVPFCGQKASAFLEQIGSERKHSYLEAVEFLETVCEALVRASGHISFSALRLALHGHWNPEHRYSVAIIFYYLFKGVDSPAVFSIYQVVSSHLYWGIHLKKVAATESLRERNHAACLVAIDALEQHAYDTSIRLLKALLKTLYMEE